MFLQYNKNPKKLYFSDLMGHYDKGNGVTYSLPTEQFDFMVRTMDVEHKLDFNNKVLVDPKSGIDGLYFLNFSAYDTDYENQVDSGTFYFNKNGIAGYSDYWNFDSQPSGNKPIRGEVKTYIGSFLKGSSFWVLYGIVPPEQYRPKK